MWSDRDWARVRKLEKDLLKAFGNELERKERQQNTGFCCDSLVRNNRYPIVWIAVGGINGKLEVNYSKTE